MADLFSIKKQLSPRLEWVARHGIAERRPTLNCRRFQAVWSDEHGEIVGRSTVSAEDACLDLIEKSGGLLKHWREGS